MALDYTDPDLISAVMKQESGGDPDAVSSKGAVGTMQTMPSTLGRPGYGVTPAKDDSPEERERVGKEYLAAMGNKYPNSNHAFMAYNWGPTNVDNWLASGADPSKIPPETINYVKNVNNNYRKAKAGKTQTTATVTPAAYETQEQGMSDDPFDVAKAALAKGDLVTNDNKDADPFEVAKTNLSKQETEQQASVKNQTPSKPFLGDSTSETLKDIAESIPSGFVRGVNNLPKLPGAMYKFASQVGAQAGNHLNNALYPNGQFTPEQQDKNIQNAGNDKVGNTLSSAPSFSQMAAVVANPLMKLVNPSMANNLTYEDLTAPENDPVQNSLHTPTTGIGQVASDTAGAIPGGTAAGLKPGVVVGGALGAQAADAASPNNPLLQLGVGAASGAAKPLLKATNFRTPPAEVANKIIQNNGGNGLNIDTSEIIPGSKPTLAEATGDPNLAVVERQMQMQDPSSFAAHEAEREVARKQHFEDASGTPQDIEQMKNDRESQSTPLYETAKNQPLDQTAVHPVLDEIDKAVALVGDGSDAGKTLLKIKDKIKGALPTTENAPTGLLDANGKPITAPKAKNATQSPLVQIYREERDNLQKPASSDGAYAGTVKSVIQPIVSKLGDAIESQSPEFAKAQQIYRDMSPKIDAAQWLQGLKLTDASGRFTLAKVNNALQNANKMRSANGLNSAKSLTADQMENLTKLRDDLQRRESVARASMPRNSTTTQNNIATDALNSGLASKANNLMGGHVPSTLGAGVGAGIGSLFGAPNVGAMFGEMAGRNIGNAAAGRSAASSAALKNYLLNPEAYKQYLSNQVNNTFADRLSKNLFNH